MKAMLPLLFSILPLLPLPLLAACGAADDAPAEIHDDTASAMVRPHPWCPVMDAVCGNTCASLSTDPKNCGACFHACAAGQACVLGRCTACTTNAQCPSGQYCEHPAGQCGAAGACVAIPVGLCAANYPVCGCDGVSYPSPCWAEENGVSLKSAGACP